MFPTAKARSSLSRDLKKSSSKIRDSSDSPISRHFVFSPMLPQKPKYSRNLKRNPFQKVPLKCLDEYRKEKILSEAKEINELSKYFKSLQPRLLNFFNPSPNLNSQVRVSSRLASLAQVDTRKFISKTPPPMRICSLPC